MFIEDHVSEDSKEISGWLDKTGEGVTIGSDATGEFNGSIKGKLDLEESMASDREKEHLK